MGEANAASKLPEKVRFKLSKGEEKSGRKIAPMAGPLRAIAPLPRANQEGEMSDQIQGMER